MFKDSKLNLLGLGRPLIQHSIDVGCGSPLFDVSVETKHFSNVYQLQTCIY